MTSTVTTLLTRGSLILTLLLNLVGHADTLRPQVMELLPPNANFMITADLAELNKSAMYKKWQAFIKDEQQKVAANDMTTALLLELSKRLEETTGLKEKDFLSATFAADMRQVVKFHSNRVPENSDFLLVVAVAKPVSFATLKQAIALLAGSAEPTQKPVISTANHAGIEMVVLSDPNAQDSADAMAATMLGNNQIVAIGSQRTLAAAITREAQQKTAALPLDMRTLQQTVADNQFYMLFALTDRMQAKLKEQAAAAAANPSLQSMVMQPLQNLHSLTVAAKFDAKMTLTVAGSMPDPAAAQHLQIMLDSVVIKIIKGMIAGQTNGQPLELLNTITATVAPGNVVKLTAVISEQDLTVLQNAKSDPASAPPAGTVAPQALPVQIQPEPALAP